MSRTITKHNIQLKVLFREDYTSYESYQTAITSCVMNGFTQISEKDFPYVIFEKKIKSIPVNNDWEQLKF